MHGSFNCWVLATCFFCTVVSALSPSFAAGDGGTWPTECCIAPVITVWVVICVCSPTACCLQMRASGRLFKCRCEATNLPGATTGPIGHPECYQYVKLVYAVRQTSKSLVQH